MAQTLPLSLEAGAEPLPGYRLLEPLGRGGFGEVWKCEVPGGLFKAIKFVKGGEADGGLAAQELEALRRVRDIRHPFILSLDRVELIDDTLLIIMELADRSLQAVAADYQALGLPGVPRDELLGYLLEAAEALDWMNFGHDLQHLDIKPHNLFVVSTHVKVADFGLVHSLKDISPTKSGPRDHGLTPMYASPELLRGSVSRHSDQYSLAVVYQQLLTGSVPFWHESPYQLLLLHLSAEPHLATLPPVDRPLVARALSKAPEDRFPSCLDFLQSLLAGHDTTRAGSPPAGPTPSRRPPALWRNAPPPELDTERPTKTVRKVRPADATTTNPPPPPPPAPSRPQPALGEVGDRRAPPASDQPTFVSLPGYRFLHCLGQNGLGDVWAVEGSEGRELRALCLHAFASESAALLQRLQALQHPSLPPTTVFWGPTGRVVLVGARFEATLRDRFEQCWQEGRQGVPRIELLGYLRQAAEALDALQLDQGLQHLALNPRSLALLRGRLWLTDFGLVPLVWLPTGKSVAQLNARYAAPGPGDEGPGADQYSLALIYAEMLTGIHPRPQRLSSGLHRRLAAKGASRPPAPRTPQRIDLELLPGADREVIARALHSDPARRYPNCTALVEALEAAGAAPPGPKDLYHCLPLVIPFRSLLGEPPAAGAELPSLGQIVLELTAVADPLTVHGPQNFRYVLHPGGAWEYRCPLRLVPGSLPVKIDGFRQQWNARTLSEGENVWVFRLDLQSPRRFWERGAAPPPPHLEVHLEVRPVPRPETRLSEAVVRVHPRGGQGDQASRILAGMGPQLFESLRSYLEASPEQRAEERWPCTHPLHVYPVLPDLGLAEVVQATGKNVSHGGINFRVAAPPPTDHVYLHWYDSPRVSAFAVLARVIRVLPSGPDRYEVGALFPVDGPSP
ncbi:MAG TPA: protein kinase [Gemmataceae bacterium]|nr:protein kinase [Gemmataceae bacterium]